MTVINTEIAETVEITSNGMHDVAKYTSANVAVPKVINSLNVTPTTSAQQITATGGVDGYSPVNVSAVTSSIDANITAGNIKDGVTILGVTGNYQGGGGGGGKTLTYVAASDGRLVPNNTTMFDFTGVRIVEQSYMFDHAWANSNISGAISFGDLQEISGYAYCFAGAFVNAEYITSVDMSNLINAGASACQEMFSNASSLASIDFSMLQYVGEWAFDLFIAGTQITDLYFPSFKPNQSDMTCFAGMLSGTDGVTLHLPDDAESVVENFEDYPNFSGDNVTLLYDLPSTAVRYGSNGAAYKRYPKYDTATALAWYNVYPAQKTPSYTSGLSDPQVGDNIYSNAAFTTVEATITSIESLE